MVMSTSVHPRMGVLVQTLSKALDDLLHLGLLQGLFFGTFAFLTYINYGGEAFDFSTFTVTLTTLLQITLGNVPGDLTLFDDTSMYFVLIFLFINNFIVLNFIIAIIVDAYAKVQEEVQSDDSERGFLDDVVMVHVAIVKSWREGWHSVDETLQCLEYLSTVLVNPEDMLLVRAQLGMTDVDPTTDVLSAKLFRERERMRGFFNFYVWFGVEAEPPAPPPAPQQDPLVKGLCTALDVPVPGPVRVVKHTESKRRPAEPPGAVFPSSSVQLTMARSAEVAALKGQVASLQAALKAQEVALDAVNRLASQQAEELARARGGETSGVSPPDTVGAIERVRSTPHLGI